MENWDQDTLIKWVDNLPKFTDTQKKQIIAGINENEIEGEVICDLSKDDLKDLGINGIVAAKLFHAIADEKNKYTDEKNKYTAKTIKEGDVNNTDGVDIDFDYEIKDDNISDIKRGILVDTGISFDNDDEKKETLVRYYPDLDGKSKVSKLLEKMAEYCYHESAEMYILYKDKERSAQITDKNATISSIWQPDKDDKNVYMVYAKKILSTAQFAGNDEKTCDALSDEVETARKISKNLSETLVTRRDLVKGFVDTLHKKFTSINKDPSLRAVISLERAKHYLKEKDTQLFNQEKERKKKLYQYPKPSTLSTVNSYIGLIGSGMGLLSTACSVYKWKQARNIAYWDKISEDNKKILTDFKKPLRGKEIQKRLDDKTNADKQSKRISIRRQRARWVGRGLKTVGALAQIAGLGLGIASIIKQIRAEKDHYKDLCDKLRKILPRVYSDFEDVGIMYDGICDTLWNLKELYEISFYEITSKRFEKVNSEQKPTVKNVAKNMKDTLGSIDSLDALFYAISDATADIDNYLQNLQVQYEKCSTWLDISCPKETNYYATIHALIDYFNKKVYNEKYTQKDDELEIYYHTFIVHLIHRIRIEQNGQYKYNISVKDASNDNIVVEVLDKDNIFTQDLYKCNFFKEFDLDKYILQEISGKNDVERKAKMDKWDNELKYVAFVRNARKRYVIFSGYAAEAGGDDNTNRKFPFLKYPITFVYNLLKIYKANSIEKLYKKI
eukprot:27171_1